MTLYETLGRRVRLAGICALALVMASTAGCERSDAAAAEDAARAQALLDARRYAEARLAINDAIAERDDEPVRYGIVKQLGSFNILWAAVHEWVGIAKDVWHAPWKHKLSYMWREPGWSHDGSRATSAMIKERWAAGRPAEEPAE